MPFELEKISSEFLRSLPPTETVFIFPVAALEDHGPHLPLGAKFLAAQSEAKRLGEKIESEMKGWKTVLVPPAPLGIETNTTEIALSVRPHVLRDWLVDACRGLKRAGFRHFVCLSGQLSPKQLTAIEEAGKILAPPFKVLNRSKARLYSVSSVFPSQADVLRSPFFPDPEEHGGEKDTSKALVLYPELVNELYRTLPQQSAEGSRLSRWIARLNHKRGGYWGNPAGATPEKGESQISKEIHQIFRPLQSTLQGSPALSKFRTWYSVVPSNKSFFKSWLLVMTLFFLVLFWFYLAFYRLLSEF